MFHERELLTEPSIGNTERILRLLEPDAPAPYSLRTDVPYHGGGEIPTALNKAVVGSAPTAETTAETPAIAETPVDREVKLFAALRWCFGIAAILVAGGLSLMSFALFTDAGPPMLGIALMFMWFSAAVVSVGAHCSGTKAGLYLFGKDWSLDAVIFSVGMTLVALAVIIDVALQ